MVEADVRFRYLVEGEEARNAKHECMQEKCEYEFVQEKCQW